MVCHLSTPEDSPHISVKDAVNEDDECYPLIFNHTNPT